MSPREKMILQQGAIWFVLALFAAGIVYMKLGVRQEMYADLHSKVIEAGTTLRRAQANLKELRAFEKNLALSSARAAAYTTSIPADGCSLNTLVRLDEVARLSPVACAGVTIHPPRANDPFGGPMIHMEVLGTYPEVRRFLHGVEEHEAFAALVTRYVIERADTGKPGQPPLRAQVQFALRTRGEPPAPKAAKGDSK